jgi:hypothetical protein
MTKTFLVFGISFLFSISLNAYAPIDTLSRINTDNGEIVFRTFDEDNVNEFRNDPDYQYKAIKREGLTWWDRLRFAVMEVIARVLALATGTVLGRIILYVLCAALIIFFIIRFLNVDIKEAFYRTTQTKAKKLSADDENIHEISFEERINEAYAKKDFRECVRLTFLYTLKKLADRQVISWKPGKTNDEYSRELNQHVARQSWQELRLYFDYAWYGHFDIDEKTYSEIQNVFADFNKKVS